jgi:hypothetical protein
MNRDWEKEQLLLFENREFTKGCDFLVELFNKMNYKKRMTISFQYNKQKFNLTLTPFEDVKEIEIDPDLKI